MGFKCVFCKKDFGTDKAQLEQHILTEHQEEEFDGKVGSMNLCDMLQKALLDDLLSYRKRSLERKKNG